MALQSDSQEINLIIEGQVFKVFKNVLSEHSDYFAAMFSGKYMEQDKTNITINVVDANSMDIILRYINVGRIELSEFSLKTIETLALASNFLQITELNKQIEIWLDRNLSCSNWMEIMNIAEQVSFRKLVKYAGYFGLLSFKTMKPEHIPNLKRLFWYLSHPYLDTSNELDVFKFGYKWILHPTTCSCADILLIIIGCLDLHRLTCQELKEIILLMDNCDNSLVAKVVECFKMLLDNKLPMTTKTVQKYIATLQETFSEDVVKEVINLLRFCPERKLVYTPVVAVWLYKEGFLESVPHYLYKYTREEGFKGWLEVADKNMWGWNITAWGANKLVLVCGEYGRGMGRFMTDVKVYDTLRQEWTLHGVKLPSRRHAGVAVLGDFMYIVGGVGPFRVLEDTTIVYDLKNKYFYKTARFPESIQSPAICIHYDSVYGAGVRNIYKYEIVNERATWVNLLETDIRASYMISYKEYIYCSQNYFTYLYRFRPGFDQKLERVVSFHEPPVGFINMERSLLAFTGSSCGTTNMLNVEKYFGPCLCPANIMDRIGGRCCLSVLWREPDSNMAINDVAGCCTLVMSIPEVSTTPSIYHRRYIAQYGDLTYDLDGEEAARET